MTQLTFGGIEKRKGEAERIRQKYPDRIPVRFTVPQSKERAHLIAMFL
jgi:hypothetical protein